MKPNKEKKDLWRMDLKQLETLVGHPPVSVEIHNQHVVCRFADDTSQCTVRFKKW